EAPRGERGERGVAVAGGGDPVSLVFEQQSHRLADLRIVVHDQHLELDFLAHGRPLRVSPASSSGSDSRAQVPPPSRSTSVAVPPCWVAMSRTSASPSPLPRALLLT